MSSNQAFWRNELQDWLSSNGRENCNLVAANPPWEIVFPFAVQNIWKSRKMFMFSRKNRNPNLAVEIVNQATKFIHLVSSPRLQTCKVIKRICWERPPQGQMKLNMDGLSNGDTGLAVCEGVIRDDRGRQITSFSRRIGFINSFEVELWGLREGLMLCCNLNISCLVIELDAKAIVDVLGNSSYVNNIISPILDDCRLLASRFQQIRIESSIASAR